MKDEFDHDEGPGLFSSAYFWVGLVICLGLLGTVASCIFGGDHK